MEILFAYPAETFRTWAGALYFANIEDHLTRPEDRRLLALYRKGAEGGSPPHIRLLGGEVMEELSDVLTVAERNARGEFSYLYYGEAVSEMTGHSYVGKSTANQPPKSGAQARRSFQQVAQTLAPLYSIDRESDNGRVHLWGRLHLPFRDADGRIIIVTINRPREYTDELLREILDAAADGILAVKAVRGMEGEVADFSILAANAPMAEFLSTDLDRLRATSILRLFPGALATGVWTKHLSVLETRRCVNFESKLSIGGVDRWFRVVSSPLNDGLVISYSDITQLKTLNMTLEEQHRKLAAEITRRAKVERELWRLAHIDPLTGLANRRSIQDRATRALAAARVAGAACTLIEMDIDHFKRINDSYGHAAGDAAIKRVADVARSAVRKDSDVVARTGGEEFVILLTETSIEDGLAIAERLRKEIEIMTIRAGGAEFQITVSFGIAASTAGSDYEGLLSSADQALYRAKRGGRNRTVADDTTVVAA